MPSAPVKPSAPLPKAKQEGKAEQFAEVTKPVLVERVENVRADLTVGWEDVPDEEVILRKFDLDLAYGPCMGISRKDRWLRAQRNGANPPQRVWDILVKAEEATAAEQQKPGSKKQQQSTTKSSKLPSQSSLWDQADREN